MKVVALTAIALFLLRKGILSAHAYPAPDVGKHQQSWNNNNQEIQVDTIGASGFEEETSIPPEQKCPNDFTRFGDVCKREVFARGFVKCPKRSYPEGDYCVEVDSFDSQEMCPEGFFVKGPKCSKTEVRLADVVCAEGFTRENGVCIRMHEAEIIQDCPKGYKFSVRGCLKKTVFSANFSCPQGYDLQAGKCHIYEQWKPELRCASAYSLKDGLCVQVLTRQPKYSCPKGYKPDGTVCTTYSKVDSDLLCSIGTLSKNKCVVETQVPPIPECQSGYSLKMGACVKTTTEVPKMECQSIGFKPAGDRCIKEVVSKPDFVCPPGSHIMKDKCHHVVKELATSSCPAGFTFTDGECVKHELGEAHYSCPFGYKPDEMNTCTKDRKVKPTYTCVEGELKGKECFKREIVDPIQPCASGSKGPACENTVTAPRLVCPKYSTMDTTGRCATKTSVHSVPSCPPGTIPTGKTCEKSTASPPKITCPLGYHEEANKCAKYETTSPTRQCPERMILKKNMCYVF